MSLFTGRETCLMVKCGIAAKRLDELRGGLQLDEHDLTRGRFWELHSFLSNSLST